MKEATRAGLAVVLALAVFYMLLLVMKWHLLVAVVIAVLIYFAVYMLTKPVLKIGSVQVDNLRGGEDLHQMMSDAHQDMQVIYNASQMVRDEAIKQKAVKLHALGNRILTYLGNNPERIPRARRFFTYYLDTGANILTKYMNLVASNPESAQVQGLAPGTARAMDALHDAFVSQFNKLMQNEILDVEVDIELLEKTLKLEGLG